MAVDLVCGMVVDEKSAPASSTYGGDEYHFCATYCKDVFNKEPEKFINGVKEWGKTTDPVCGMLIDIADAAAMSIHKGRFIYFCNSACKEKFDADPEKYLKSKTDDAEMKPPAPNRTAKNLKTVEFPVSGMSCASCVARIEKGLAKMSGIQEAKVNFASEKASVTFDPSRVQMVDLVGTVKDLGYEAGLAKVTLPVHGMSCASCVKRVEGALNGLDGVVKAGVNFATERATIQYIPGTVALEDFKKAVREAGYEILETGQVEKQDVVDQERAARETQISKIKTVKNKTTLQLGGVIFPVAAALKPFYLHLDLLQLKPAPGPRGF